MRLKINDTVIARLRHSEAGQYCVWDASLPGFGVRVSTRSKSFVLKKANHYQVLGRYPAVSLKQARDEAKRRIALKYFPEPQTSIHAIQAIDEYLRTATVRPKSHYLYARALEAHFPKKPLHTITLQELKGIINKLPPSNANLTQAIFTSGRILSAYTFLRR